LKSKANPKNVKLQEAQSKVLKRWVTSC